MTRKEVLKGLTALVKETRKGGYGSFADGLRDAVAILAHEYHVTEREMEKLVDDAYKD